MHYQIVEIFGIDKYLHAEEIYVNGKAVDGLLIDVLNSIRSSGFVLKTHIQVANTLKSIPSKYYSDKCCLHP